MTHSPVPFDPELAAVLPMIHRIMGPDTVQTDTIATLRAGLPGMHVPTDEELSTGGAFTVEDRLVPGPPGTPDLSLLICRPSGTTTPSGAILFMHGGGMVLGDNRAGIDQTLRTAADLGLAVVSIEYRLAPETPAPGPADDCYAALVWIASHADSLGIDPSRIVVGGSSAGGGLAAAVGLMARDLAGPPIAGLLLLSPMLDDRNDSVSARQTTGLGLWDSSSNEAGWTALLGNARGSESVPAYAAPARASELAGLPPTFVEVGSAETFRDEDVSFASRLWSAGGDAELHVWPGAFHGFEVFAPHAAVSQDCLAARQRWLIRVLAR